MRALPIVSVFTLLFAAAAAPVRTPQPEQFPITFGTPRVVGADEEFGAIAAVKVARNGNVYVVDFMNARLTAFAPEGRVLWRLGRKGRGPGEFQRPYRIAVNDDNGVLVFDAGTGEVTSVSPEGRYLGRYLLPFAFANVDDLVSPENREIVIVGITMHSAASRFAVHRFQMQEGRLKHVGSFAPLPIVRDPRVLRMWGAGTLTRAADGDLVFTRRLPYEIYGFSAFGAERWRFRAPIPVRGSPDEAFRIEQRGAATQYAQSGADVTRPLATWKLEGGRLLASHRTGDRVHWIVLSRTGTLLGSWQPPKEWGGIVGFDPTRRLVWLSGKREDEPVLYQLTFSLARS